MGIWKGFASPYKIPRGIKPADRARELLDRIHFCCDEINKTENISYFSQLYNEISILINELIWINEKKKVSMTPPPRDQWESIQRNMPATINRFIRIASHSFPYSGEDRADAIEAFLDEMQSCDLFSSFMDHSNRLKIEELRQEVKKLREEVTQRKRADHVFELTKQLGFKRNLDLSDFNPLLVVELLEKKLQALYQDSLKQCLSKEEINKVFTSFKDNCLSSQIPLAASVRLEDLLVEYEKKFNDSASILIIDSMEGHDFEYWCASLLEKIGFTDVEVTRGSGDHGVDVLAEKDGIRYAIQCKCYSKDLGNSPVQEVSAGKMIPQYRCQIGAVMTNRYFTKGAQELAAATGTLLWDRDWIIKSYEKIN